MKALEKDRTRRYQTANALALDVRRHLNHEPVSAGPPSAAYRTRKFVRRHRVGVAAATALVALLLAFAGIMTVQAGRIARERDRANQEAATAKQVSDFLVGLFRVSDPSEARGNTLTAREILAKGARQLEGGLRDQPQVQARLQATIGAVYTGLGTLHRRPTVARGALQTQRHVLGEDSAETSGDRESSGQSRTGIKGNIRRPNRCTATSSSGERACWEKTTRTRSGPTSTWPVHTRHRNAGMNSNGSPGTCWRRQRRVLGYAHADTLSSLNNLRYVYYNLGRYAEAEPLAVEVAEAKGRLHGDDHPETLICPA